MSQARRSREEWREIIAQQQASGLTVAAFCRRVQLSPVSFFAWRRKLQARAVADGARPTFAEVKILPEASAAATALELHWSSDRWIAVRPGFDRRTLLELLAALEAGA